MGNVLEFNELGVGQQIGVGTTDRGVISGVAVPNGGVGGAPWSVITSDPNVSKTFNGDGSGGAVVLPGPQTIIVGPALLATEIAWTFGAEGVANGWIVALAIDGTSPGELSIIAEDLSLLTIVNATSTAGLIGNVPYPVLFYNAGWFLLRSQVVIP